MKKQVFLDVECFKNYFLICFKTLDNQTHYYEIMGSTASFDIKTIRSIDNAMKTYKTYGFNSLHYDMPMITAALAGFNASQLKDISNELINKKESLSAYEVYKKYNLYKNKDWEHIDIRASCPCIKTSLKTYGARMHVKKIQDLPYHHTSIILNGQNEVVRDYCFNDLDITIELYKNVKDEIEVKEEISKQYGIDLTSKTKSQITETIIKKELGINGKIINIEDLSKSYKYKCPEILYNSSSDTLKSFIDKIESIKFKTSVVEVEGSKKVRFDDNYQSEIIIGGYGYMFGIGGLHSKEKKRNIVCNGDVKLIDLDVTSYYPSLLLNYNYFPAGLGSKLRDTFKSFLDERIRLKSKANKSKNDVGKMGTFKIVLNGTYGKYGDMYSVLFDPLQLLSTTLTGQIAILLLVEMLVENRIKVVSANTDGVTIQVSCDRYKQVILDWQHSTNLRLEEIEYKSLYTQSVNNYIAIGDNTKLKGIFAQAGIAKNPVCIICNKALIEFLQHKVSIEKTIRNCTDIREFFIIGKLKEGAIWRNQYIGNTVRYYYSKNGSCIYSKINKNKMPNSDGAMPMQEICDNFPDDLDYDVYIDKTYKLLESFGIHDNRNTLFSCVKK